MFYGQGCVVCYGNGVFDCVYWVLCCFELLMIYFNKWSEIFVLIVIFVFDCDFWQWVGYLMFYGFLLWIGLNVVLVFVFGDDLMVCMWKCVFGVEMLLMIVGCFVVGMVEYVVILFFGDVLLQLEVV